MSSGRVCRLRQGDLDLAIHRVHVYAAVRGSAATDHVFAHCHRPLSPTFCYDRLRTHGRRCGMRMAIRCPPKV